MCSLSQFCPKDSNNQMDFWYTLSCMQLYVLLLLTQVGFKTTQKIKIKKKIQTTDKIT